MKSVPRLEAATLLSQVLTEGHPLDEALRAGAARLGPQERAWLWDVCSGVLRFKPRLDLAIDSLALKKKPSGRMRRLLLVAAYQIIFQETVTPEKVVDETVGTIKKKDGAPPANFANALLRKLLAQRKLWQELPAPETGTPEDQLSAFTGLPADFQKRVRDQRGFGYLVAFARAVQERPRLWVHQVGSHSANAKELSNGAFQKGPIPGAYWVSEMAEGFESLPGYSEGMFFAQDLSSQIALHSVIEREGPGKSPTVLDLCAAPGGKALHLADAGWKVLATDRSAKRLERVGENLRRLKLPVEIGQYETIVASPEKSDWVWIDAPCSGSGIIRRHPDAKFTREEKSLDELKKTQAELLKVGSRKAERGLVYSVCSIFKDEAEEQVEGFLRSPEGARFRLVEERLLSPQDANGPDGFYFAILSSASS